MQTASAIQPSVSTPSYQVVAQPQVVTAPSQAQMVVPQVQQAPYQAQVMPMAQVAPVSPYLATAPYQTPANPFAQQVFSQPNSQESQLALQLAQQAIQALSGRNGNNPYQPQADQYLGTDPYSHLNQAQRQMGQGYRDYPQTYPPQSQPNYTPTTSNPYIPQQTPIATVPPGVAETLRSQGIPTSGISPDQINGGYATTDEILAAYGNNPAIAMDSLNKYACALEDQGAALVQALKIREAQLGQALQKLEADNHILTNLDILGPWYLDLSAQAGETRSNWRQVLAEGGNAKDISLLQPPPQLQQQMQQQRMQQQQMDPQMAQMQQMMNPGANPAALAAQYMQSAATGQPMPGMNQVQRPSFPQVPVAAGQGMGMDTIYQVPPSQRWQVIDQLSAQGGFRGTRIRL